MQFYHTTHQALLISTIAIEFPKKEFFEEVLIKSHATDILLPVGISIKSPKDVFNKKIGREVALTNLKAVPCTFTRMYTKGMKHIYNFEILNYAYKGKKYNLHISCTTVKESDAIWLIDGGICVKC